MLHSNSLEQVGPIVVLTPQEGLDHATIDILTQDLLELEKNPAYGWNVRHPALYQTLYTITEELCAQLNCPMPNLFIDLSGVNRHQSSAHQMIDNTTQLHLGIDFIRTFLLTTSGDRARNYRAFRWTLAHELGHFCDPLFVRFGRSYAIRQRVDQITAICFWSCITGLMLSGNNIYRELLVAIIAFMALKYLVFILLFRKFEYFADRKSVNAINADPADVCYALTTMTSAAHDAVVSPFKQATDPFSRTFGWYYKKIVWTKLSLFHPSINCRIKRLSR